MRMIILIPQKCYTYHLKDTNMNKPFELKVIVAIEEVWDGGVCSECAFHHVDNCGQYDCKYGIFKVIDVVEECKEEE